MNGLQMQHPEDGLLLRYADGELTPREAAEVRSHLESCWQCRSELEGLGKTVAECVRYRKYLSECLPPPPAPWRDLSAGYADVDATLARPALLARLGRALAPPAPLRWAALAAGAVLAAVLLQQFQNPPSAQAAELLNKAVAAAESRKKIPKRLAIRTRQRTMTRWMGAPAGVALPAIPAAFERELESLEALFLKSNYNWDDPLSALSFQQWRDSLHEKRDEVNVAGGANGWHLVRTSTNEGELAEASLKLRADGFEPVEGRFEFRNREWVEISEIPAQPGLAVEAAPAPAGQPLTAPAPEARGLETAAPPPASLGDELAVLAALQRVGADLGDPVEVSRSGGHVVVSGLGVEPERRREIEQALGSLDKVVLRFSDGAPPAPAEDASRPADISVRASGSSWPERMQRQLGGRPPFERMTAQILDESEMMMSRVYALKRLADRFPESAVPQLGPEGGRLLLELHQDHAVRLAGQAADLERVLNPLLQSLGASFPEPQPPPAASWQAATQQAFRAARGVERLLARLLGGTEEGVSDAGLPSELAAGLAQLRAAVGACRRASAPPTGGDSR